MLLWSNQPEEEQGWFAEHDPEERAAGEQESRLAAALDGPIYMVMHLRAT